MDHRGWWHQELSDSRRERRESEAGLQSDHSKPHRVSKRVDCIGALQGHVRRSEGLIA
jgi:hypothetical protein